MNRKYGSNEITVGFVEITVTGETKIVIRTFEMIAHTSSEIANNTTCFWNTRCVFCRTIATMIRMDRNSALAALRYETMLALPARAGHPVSMLHHYASRRLFKRSQAVIRPDSTT